MVAFLAALPAFIQALPLIFETLSRVMSLFVRFVDWAEKNELKKWISNLEDTMDGLEKAKTPEEKRESARKIGDILRGMG